MYQSSHAAAHSSDEHWAIVDALERRDENLALAQMAQHLQHVEEGLQFDRQPPSHDIAMALS